MGNNDKGKRVPAGIGLTILYVVSALFLFSALASHVNVAHAQAGCNACFHPEKGFTCPAACPNPTGLGCGGYDSTQCVPDDTTISRTTTTSTTTTSPTTTTTTRSTTTSTSTTPSTTTTTTRTTSTTTTTTPTTSTSTILPSQCGLLPPSLANTLETKVPWYCPINGQIYGVWVVYLPFVLIVILLAFTIAALIFMVGTAMRSAAVRNFGIGELYEAAASALIVVFFLYVCAVVFGLLPGIAVGAINPYATAFNLILGSINSAEATCQSIFLVYMIDSFFVSINIKLEVFGVSASAITSTVTSIYSLYLQLFFIQPAAVLATFLVDGIAALYSQYYIIVFFAVASIPVFIVPGVIFRAIFPTRALGGVLMAIGIGFYLVMPTLFAIAYYFTAPSILHALAVQGAQFNRWGSGAGAEINALSSSAPLPLALNGVKSALSSFWLLILFYPVLIVAVTYAFITQLANFIGGASRKGGRISRIVFVFINNMTINRVCQRKEY